jgi:hypothetical protein
MSAKIIDPAHPTAVLEVLSQVGIPSGDAWAEIQYITLQNGTTGIAASIRSVLDDGLLVRHVSGIKAGEDLEDALDRVARSLDGCGLRTVGVLPGEADADELFHTEDSLRQLMGEEPPATPSTPSVH